MTTTVEDLREDLLLTIRLRPGQQYSIDREDPPEVVEGKSFTPGTFKIVIPSNCDILIEGSRG